MARGDDSAELTVDYLDVGRLERRDESIFRMYQSGFQCDVALLVHKNWINVHGIVLVAASDYFRVMLESGYRESSSRSIDLSSSFDSVEVLRSVVDYMYTSRISLSRSAVDQVLGAADIFMMNDLKAHCAQFLFEQLQPQNFLTTWKLAHVYGLRELEVVCESLIREKFCSAILNRDDLASFSESDLKTVVERGLLNRAGPAAIAEFFSLWMSVDVEARKTTTKGELLRFLQNQPIDIAIDIIKRLLNATTNRLFRSMEISNDFPDFLGQLSWKRGTEATVSRRENTANENQFLAVLVREDGCSKLTFFCDQAKKWYSKYLLHVSGRPVGIIKGNYLVTVKNDQYSQYVSLLSLTTGDQIVTSPAPRSDTVVPEFHKWSVDHYCFSGSLHALVGGVNSQTGQVALSVYGYSVLDDCWSLLLKIDNKIFASLKRDRPGGPFLVTRISVAARSTCHDDIFVFATMAAKSARAGMRAAEMREACHVFRVDMVQGSSSELWVCDRFSPVDLSECHCFIHNNKLCLVGSWNHRLHGDGRPRMTAACLMKTLNMNLKSKMRWKTEKLEFSFPDLEYLPIVSNTSAVLNTPFLTGEKLPKFFENRMYVDMRIAPHFYRVYTTSPSSSGWTCLPPVPIPAVRTTSLFCIYSYKPICQIIDDNDSKSSVDMTGLYFRNFRLNDWSGTWTPPAAKLRR